MRGEERETASADVGMSHVDMSPVGDATTGRPDGGGRWHPQPRRLLVSEVWLVLGVSLGASALWAVVRYIGDLTAPGPLRKQVAELNSSAAPGRPWLDLSLQVVGIATALVPAFLALHMFVRDGAGLATIGLDRRQPRHDAVFGAGLAAAVGGTGLGLYLIAWHSGTNLTVVPADLPDVWWRIPVLVLSAVENAVLEEVVVVGYLLTRLRQLGWSDNRALATSALLRGSYHFYQGIGGFVGNLVMGLLFGRIYQRRGRIGPLVVAHSLIDAVAFVGYTFLAGRVSWLPIA